jgi:hypothetical protein
MTAEKMDTEEVIRRIRDRGRYTDNIDIDADQLMRLLNLRDPPLQMVAEVSASLAAGVLSIEPPKVFEILPGQQEGRDGFAATSKHDNRIHVRLQGKCPCYVAKVAAHETRHRWQFATGRFYEMLGKKETEPDAEIFANEFFQRFKLSRRCACQIVWERR